MKVLHVAADIDPEKGGVSQAVRMIIAGLSVLGVSSEIVTLDNKDSIYIANSNLSVQPKGPGRGPWQYNKKLIPHLVKHLLTYDIIIVHGLWLYHSFATSRSLKLARKKQGPRNVRLPKLFVMPHGMLDPYFQKATGRKFKAIRNWIYWRTIEKNVVNKADGLLFTCERERQLASQTFKAYNPKSQKVVGLGIERPPSFIPRFQEAFLEQCPGVRNFSYILFLGRIDAKKGLDLLIKGYSAVVESYNKTATSDSFDEAANQRWPVFSPILPKLVIAGPGIDTPFGESLRQLVYQTNLSSEIHFTGMLTGDAKWGAYYGSEIFILPSHQENFGLAVVEALACSKPVLISDQVNIWQEVTKQKAGFVGDDSLNGTIRSLKEWLRLPSEEKEKMSKNAKKCYELNFGIVQTAEKLFELFKEKAIQ